MIVLLQSGQRGELSRDTFLRLVQDLGIGNFPPAHIIHSAFRGNRVYGPKRRTCIPTLAKVHINQYHGYTEDALSGQKSVLCRVALANVQRLVTWILLYGDWDPTGHSLDWSQVNSVKITADTQSLLGIQVGWNRSGKDCPRVTAALRIRQWEVATIMLE